MPTYIALFRAINVGGNNILPMKDLISLLERNGYQNVKTYIQTGNVVFQSKKKPEADVSALIEKQFGFKPALFILSAAEFLGIAKGNPYKTKEGKFAHVYFCNSAPKADLKRIKELTMDSEHFTIKGKAFYLHAPDGIARSKLVAKIDACLGVPATGRNLNTVNKLLAMIE